jgi:tripartite-type tricarboxylate transporter receptor subunit TctC
VARAKPDGYTFMFSHMGPITISPAIQKIMPYDSVKDLAPITQIVSSPNVLIACPALPVRSRQDLVRYASGHPGKLSCGSVGPDSTTHLAVEILSSIAGIELLHVPFKGAAPVIADVIGKQIDMAFLNATGVAPLLKEGTLRGLGVSTLKRNVLVRDLPTIAESYLRFEVYSQYGFMAPGGTPRPIANLLQKHISQILKEQGIVRMLKGARPVGRRLDTRRIRSANSESIKR